MKIEHCLVCKKEVDVSKSLNPPMWFGRYLNEKLISVICSDCIKKETKND